MRKLILVSFLAITGIITTKAGSIDPTTAKKVAVNFYVSNNQNKSIKTLDLNLIYTSTYTNETDKNKSLTAQPLYYIYNVNDSDGFVIVAADSNIRPILGYSLSGHCDANNMPPNFVNWMKGYEDLIVLAKNKDLEANASIKNQWDELLNGKTKSIKGTKAIPPLIKTRWGQSGYYYSLCPYDTKLKQRTLTGCVATAMAQIMRYWNFPNQGVGTNTYTHKSLGTFTVNFANSTYDWKNMPAFLSSRNTTVEKNAVAKIMYDAGVSVNMNYGVDESGALLIDEFNSFKKYFNYSNKIKLISMSDPEYEGIWNQVIKAEIDASRPIQYSGGPSGNGSHAFICDGYDYRNYFHFNWGWTGAYDGYYPLDSLTAGYADINGISFFSLNQLALIYIQPNGTSVDENANNTDLYIYPNPVANTLNIKTNENIEKVEVYNVLGNKIISADSFHDVNNCSVQVDELSKGVYILQITTQEGIRTEKFIKE